MHRLRPIGVHWEGEMGAGHLMDGWKQAGMKRLEGRRGVVYKYKYKIWPGAYPPNYSGHGL